MGLKNRGQEGWGQGEERKDEMQKQTSSSTQVSLTLLHGRVFHDLPCVTLCFSSSFSLCLPLSFSLPLSLPPSPSLQDEEEEEDKEQERGKEEGKNGRIEPVGRADSCVENSPVLTLE